MRITKEDTSNETTETETMDEMLTALALAVQNKQTIMPKNIVPDPEWFSRDRIKFEDWGRGIRLFLKSNRVTGTDSRITTILAWLRGDVAGIYVQKKQIPRIRTNLLENSRWYSVIRARQQMLNRRLKHSNRTRSTLPTLWSNLKY